MSNLHQLRRIRAALVVPHTAWLVAVALPGVAIGCASRGPAAPTHGPTAEAGIPTGGAAKRDASDTSSVDIGGGKTIERLFAGRFAGVTVEPSSDGGLRILVRGERRARPTPNRSTSSTAPRCRRGQAGWCI